ncbi:MAG TPA: SIS domain-containing protein [Thermoplasmata archaeon]|nr:SIS domain-containing protein [Thermoplasmata archaeon]
MPNGGAASDPPFLRAQRLIGERVGASVGRLDPRTVGRVVELLVGAPTTFVYGAGRSGIIGRAFAMRLVQVGLTAFVIGESVTPIVRRGDAVFILSGRGESHSSIQAANIVRREGAELVVVTAKPSSKLAHVATILLPLEFAEDAEQRELAPLGTLFESASLRLTDALIAEIMRTRGESEDSMRRRHAIMV